MRLDARDHARARRRRATNSRLPRARKGAPGAPLWQPQPDAAGPPLELVPPVVWLTAPDVPDVSLLVLAEELDGRVEVPPLVEELLDVRVPVPPLEEPLAPDVLDELVGR